MRIRFRPALSSALAVVLLHGPALAQSNTDQAPAQATATASARNGLITSADIKAWNSFRGTALSNDGRWFAYVVAPTEGDATVVYRSTAPGATETRINVGEGGGAVAISGDSKWLGYIVAPPRPAPRTGNNAARNEGNAQADSTRTPAVTANKFVLVNLA